MTRFFLPAFVALLHFKNSSQHSAGSPASRCNNLLPSHSGIGSQSFPSPFDIIPSVDVIRPGDKMSVEIRADAADRTFRGFLLQARTLSTPFVIVGQFQEVQATNVGFLDCSGLRTAITQSSGAQFASRSFEWTAPTEFEGLVRFHATVVENFTTFWVDQKSEIIVVSVDATTMEPVEPTLGPEMTPPPVTVAPTTVDPALDSFYDGCGETKTCIGIGSDNCVANRVCDTVGAVTQNDGRYFFEMRSPLGANYVAIALSRDHLMGDDSVIECIRDGDSIRAFASFTIRGNGGSSPRDEIQTIISLNTSRIENGKIYCMVERESVTVVRGLLFNLIDDKHFLLLATGRLALPDSVGFHDINEGASDEALNLNVATVAQAGERSRVMLYIHASFMITSWIGLTSIGIFTARFMKRTWVKVKIFGKDLWFVTHQTVMCLTWVLTLAGFIIIVVDTNRWVTNTHSVLGTISFALCMIQPFGAILRPGPKDPSRPIFTFLHMSAGNLAHLLAVITMFYAVNLSRAQLPDLFTLILISFVTIYIVWYSAMTVMGFYSLAKEDTLSTSGEQLAADKSALDAPFSTARKVSFITFVSIVVAFVAVLIVVVVAHPF